jgi:hypothetical protein
MTKKITFTIKKGGNVILNDAQGFGTGCQEATQDIEKLLGTVDAGSRQLTESYHQQVDPLELKNEA